MRSLYFKRGFSSLLLLISIFCCSCDRASSSQQGTIELVAWVTYKGPEYEKFMELVKKFEALKNNKVKILAKQVPFDDLVTNIRMACLAKRTPDIARVDVQKILELAYHKVLVKLDELPNFEAKSIEHKSQQYMRVPFLTNVVEVKNSQGKYEQHLYGLPEQPSCLALFWNRRLFREFSTELENAGLDPKRAPRDWDELIAYAKVLTRKSGGEQYYGFAMNNSLWWTLPFFGAHGAQFVKKDADGKKFCSLGDKLSCAALQLKVDLYRKHKIEAGAWKSGAIGPDVGFVNEKYAMILMGPWNVKKFRKKGLDFGVSLIPGLSNAQAKKIGIKNPRSSSTNIGGNNLVIFDSCQYKQQAYDFLKFVTSWESQLKWCKELQQIPANRKAAQILMGENKDPQFRKIDVDPVIKVFMKQIKYAALPPQLPRYGYIESDVVNPEMELAMKGVKSIESALKAAAAKIDKHVLSLVNE